jgi:hypothetical protein
MKDHKPISNKNFFQTTDVLEKIIDYWNNCNTLQDNLPDEVKSWLKRTEQIRKEAKYKELNKGMFYSTGSTIELSKSLGHYTEGEHCQYKGHSRFFTRGTEYKEHYYNPQVDLIVVLAAFLKFTYWQCLIFALKSEYEIFYKDEKWITGSFKESINSEASTEELNKRVDEFIKWFTERDQGRKTKWQKTGKWVSVGKKNEKSSPHLFHLIQYYGIDTLNLLISEENFWVHLEALLNEKVFLYDIFNNDALTNVTGRFSEANAGVSDPVEITANNKSVVYDLGVERMNLTVNNVAQSIEEVGNAVQKLILNLNAAKEALNEMNKNQELLKILAEIYKYFPGLPPLGTKSPDSDIPFLGHQDVMTETLNEHPKKLIQQADKEKNSLVSEFKRKVLAKIKEIESYCDDDIITFELPVEDVLKRNMIFQELRSLTEVFPVYNGSSNYFVKKFNSYLSEIKQIHLKSGINTEDLEKLVSGVGILGLCNEYQKSRIQKLGITISELNVYKASKENLLFSFQESLKSISNGAN